ncbi:MAG: ferrochelatase [Hyphomicrobiales bacterium]
MTTSASQSRSSTDALPSDHKDVKFGRTGVLLVNLGTPDATDYWSMRRYLKEFLSDRRVIEVPRLIWWPLLNGIILTTRPKKSGAAYDEIWNKELDESPLRTITRSQFENLKERMGEGHPDLVFDWAMRYGNPSIHSRLDYLREQGCDRIVVVPLYPQYAAATTATVNDKVFEYLMKQRWQPAVRTAAPYGDDPAYIKAVCESLKEGIANLDFEPDLVLASFHGVPLSYLQKGDPYHCQCHKTARLMREYLGWGADGEKLKITFQSRFGKEEWLQPYTDETVKQLARDGVKKLAIIAPGFSADCVETLEELSGEAGEFFEENGGEQFAVIPCLNDSDYGMDVIENLVRRELAGWI